MRAQIMYNHNMETQKALPLGVLKKLERLRVHMDAYESLETWRELESLAKDYKHASEILIVLKETGVSAQWRKHFVTMIAQQDISQVPALLLKDPDGALAESLKTPGNLFQIPGGIAALVTSMCQHETSDIARQQGANLFMYTIDYFQNNSDRTTRKTRRHEALQAIAAVWELDDLPLRMIRAERATAFHYLVERVDLQKTNNLYHDTKDLVDTLLELGADPNLETTTRGMFMPSNLRTPLEYACFLYNEVTTENQSFPGMERLIDHLMDAGAEWISCEKGEGKAATQIRRHPRWRKAHLMKDLPVIQEPPHPKPKL